MKKLMGLTALLAVVLFPGLAMAQDYEERGYDERGYFNLSAFGSWLFNESDDANDAYYIGGRATYDLTPNIELGMESGWSTQDFENSQGADLGSVDYIPLLGIIVLKYPLEFTDNK